MTDEFLFTLKFEIANSRKVRYSQAVKIEFTYELFNLELFFNN